MPASTKRIRDTMKVSETAKKAGLRLQLNVVAYDNGIIELDGVPINRQGSEGHGWLATLMVISQTLVEFEAMANKRRKALKAESAS
jgi:hypothetical protein